MFVSVKTSILNPDSREMAFGGGSLGRWLGREGGAFGELTVGAWRAPLFPPPAPARRWLSAKQDVDSQQTLNPQVP